MVSDIDAEFNDRYESSPDPTVNHDGSADRRADTEFADERRSNLGSCPCEQAPPHRG